MGNLACCERSEKDQKKVIAKKVEDETLKPISLKAEPQQAIKTQLLSPDTPSFVGLADEPEKHPINGNAVTAAGERKADSEELTEGRVVDDLARLLGPGPKKVVMLVGQLYKEYPNSKIFVKDKLKVTALELLERNPKVFELSKDKLSVKGVPGNGWA
mmetsp:Transcript_43404/g.67978  ORF Transcript_43404/g.67978 Transcript_43404/m.67978 type:complete len:158 (+) Transcript_43404:522-995(+)|eukprot:CAMPEP_0184308236 /NCGR_PEP_ID=MMETSP1049-20130417/16745_1 /TAXON_ID=77928 /ORGANISM="Proteomonas sulcata, Strain CCMP704" /LENGTH=157 /DNA_ID=CAMNT_0026620881 /DNA_START=419 /DNA_END=892 /DNA_ORIENTATION=+